MYLKFTSISTFLGRGLSRLFRGRSLDAVQALSAHGRLRELRLHHEEVRRMQVAHRAGDPLPRLLRRENR